MEGIDGGKPGEEAMSEQARTLHFDPYILSAPLYVAGTRIDTLKEQYGAGDPVKLSSNENPLGPSPKAVAAIQEALPRLARYPPVDPLQLRQALAASVNQGVGSDHFVTGHGTTEILATIVLGFLKAGDEAIICRPTFPLYDIMTRRQGAIPAWADLDADFGFSVDRILAAVSDRTRLIFVCVPNNPTGTVMSPTDADRLVNGAPPEALVVFDESYRLFATDVVLPDSVGYVRAGRNVVVLNSMSKTHGLAGLRFGYAITSADIACYLRRLQHPFHLGELVLHGALAALDDDEYVRRSQALIAAERHWLQARLDELRLFYISSQGNFIALKPGFPADLVYERMLQQGVIIRPLGLFYMPDYIRLSIGTRADNERFLTALRKVLAELDQETIELSWSAEQPTDKVKV